MIVAGVLSGLLGPAQRLMQLVTRTRNIKRRRRKTAQVFFSRAFGRRTCALTGSLFPLRSEWRRGHGLRPRKNRCDRPRCTILVRTSDVLEPLGCFLECRLRIMVLIKSPPSAVGNEK